MSIFHINITEVSDQTIKDLLGNTSESTQLDFKREINLEKSEDKKEFLADVVSFATTMGGDIIYGIDETEGIASSIQPIVIQDIDQFKIKVSNIIRDGIEPRINFHVKEFAFDGDYVVLLRIFKLFPGPPMVTFSNSSKFFGRSVSGKYQLNYLQVKNAFNASASISETFRNFRNERINHFLNGIDGNNPSLPFMLFYVYPLNETNFDLNSLTAESIVKAIFPHPSSGKDYSYNLEGFALISHFTDRVKCLVQNQLFTNGIIEVFNDWILNLKVNKELTYTPVYLIDIESIIIKNFIKILNFYKDNSINPPYLINLCLINLESSKAEGFNEQYIHFLGSKSIKKSNLIFREYIITPDINKPIDSLRKLFDDLWRAYGKSKSESFDESGNYRRRS